MWASHCNNGGSNVTARWTNDIDGSTTWNNQPGWMGDEWAASVPGNHKYTNEHNCEGTGDVEFDIGGVVQAAANNNRDVITLVLHVGVESDTGQWKRFNAVTPVLAIDYNSPPDVPDTLTSDLKPCTLNSFVPTVTPTLRARVNDKDGDSALQARFEWARVREDGSYTPVAEVRDTYPWGSNTTAQTTIPTPPNLDDGVLDRSETLVATGDWDNDGHPDVLARDTGGYLYLFPGNGRLLRARVLLSGGWQDYTFAGIADWDNDGKKDIIARHNPTGELHMFPGNGARAQLTQTTPAKIGFGFGGYLLAGLADFDKDSMQDLIARDGNGELWLYPGEGTRAVSAQVRAWIGGGFGPFTFYGIIDRNGDGAPDIIVEYDNRLWLYPGSGKRAVYTGSPGRHEIGSGWAGARALTIPDFNGDGAVDVVAHLPGWTSWQLYPGVVGTGYGGQQWPMAGVGLTDGGRYVFRVTAGDWQVWGPPSGWCGFSVDTTAPNAPTFTSSVYKTSGCAPDGCGSLGIADTFTFSNTSTDVVKFRWGFSDPPSMTVAAAEGTTSASVRWTPPSHGDKTLFVEAVDRAGLWTRRTFDFYVAGPKPNEAQWFSGDDPAFDATGHGHDLTLTGLDVGRAGRTVGGQGAIGFDGAVVNGATTAKVLDTDREFSVSAWVRLAGDTVNRTVVSQQGAETSAFRLGYDAAEHKWVFALAESDSANAAQAAALSNAPAVSGVWTHLTGIVGGVDREVRLYVDGALQGTTSVVVQNGFAAGGQVWIGKAMRTSAVEPWLGDLAEVRAWNRAITPQDVQSMTNDFNVTNVGEWRFNEPGGSIAYDTSPYARDFTLNLAGGARFGAGTNGASGGLELNGINGSASTSGAVLNTDQSFSIDVWAKLNGTGTPRTVLAQHGPSGVDAFTLRYDGSQWSAEMPNAAVNPSTWWRAKADALANTWTHLVVTYDASARTLKLTVGYKAHPEDKDPVDVLKSTITGVVGWNFTGALSVGRNGAGEYFNGNVDDLLTYQGVLAPQELKGTPRTGASLSGDARDEIISVDASGSVRAFLNVNDAVPYPYESQVVGSGFAADRTWFADIDGDGKSEIIGVDSNGLIKAFKNVNGMNGFPFGAMSVIGTVPGETSRIRFADIDGDGRADRVSIGLDGRVRVYRNLFGLNERGQGTAFSATPVIVKITDAAPNRIRLADIDGDGKAEFITVNADQTVSAFRNLNGLGYGSYDISQEIGSDWTPDRTWFADINGDGRAEIVKVRPDGTVWSWTNYKGLNGFPFAEAKQVGSGWFEPARVFFS